jgi:F-type H+-transporting ATPase subunit epsilon
LRYKDAGDAGVFAVLGGFAEVLRDEVAVFAEAAELADEIDEEKVRQDMLKAQDALSSRRAGADLDAAEAALKIALLRLKAKTTARRREKRS